MPSPYRETEATAPAPLEELEWRRRVAASARWAAGFLLGETGLLVAARLLQGRFAMPVTIAWLVLGAAATVAAWIMSARRPGGRVDWRSWLLRGSVPAYFAVTGLLLHGMHLQIASFVTGLLLLVSALAQSGRFARWQRPQRPRAREPRRMTVWWVLLAFVSLVFFSIIVAPGPSVGYLFSVMLLVLGAVCFGDLRRALLPVEHQWWFDREMAQPGAWVSLLVFRDQQAEVLRFDKTLGTFWTKNEAIEWLEHSGYVLAEHALEDHLVSGVPPHVLPLARSRKRVQDSPPRVRVAADAPTADEVDEAAIDDAEPARAVRTTDD